MIIKMNKIVYVFILFISTNLFAQISVETDTTKIRIGEQLTYSIIVPKQENITFPSLVLEGLEVAEESNKQTLAQNIVKKYYITGFDTGAFYIKKQEVFINAKSYFTDSLLINVAGVKIDTAKIQQSLKSKIAEEEKITFSEIANRYGIFVILFLAIPLLLIILNYFLKKKKKNKPKIIIPPFVTATKELEELESKQLWQKNKTKTYYSELTDIVRKYLGKRNNPHFKKTIISSRFCKVCKTKTSRT